SGDGGKVVVWGDEGTQFYGAIIARAGQQGGDGGFAEVSGKEYLDFSGFVDLRAPLGDVGTLLLDPTDITIDNSTDSNVDTSASPFMPSGAGSVITWATIDAAIDTANLTIQTSGGFDAGQPGNITIADVGNVSSTSGFSLTLLADNDISVNASVTYGGGGDLNFSAANNVTINSMVDAGTGDINITIDSDNNSASTLTLNDTLNAATVAFTGNGSDDTLVGDSQANTWAITGADSGQLNG